MRSVGLKVLKNKLSEYVRLAARGETVLVTDRNRVVAELVPPRADHGGWQKDPLLVRLVREGLATPPTSPQGAPPRPRPVMTLDELMNELDEDREDR
jgi:prevent-host-death family protein